MRQSKIRSQFNRAIEVCDCLVGLAADLNIRSEIKKHRVLPIFKYILFKFGEQRRSVSLSSGKKRGLINLIEVYIVRVGGECRANDSQTYFLTAHQWQAFVIRDFEFL